MGIDRHTVMRLHQLHRERAELHAAKEQATPEMWASITERSMAGGGYLSTIRDVLGGDGQFSDWLYNAALVRFDQLDAKMVEEIRQLGGEP